MYLEALSFIWGLIFENVQNILGMASGRAGVEYYAEVHQSKWNSIIHTACMPFTTYGFLLAVPNILFLSRKNAQKFHKTLYLFYLGHYLMIDLYVAILYAIIYGMIALRAIVHYRRGFKFALKGVGIATTSLLIQEFIGHYLGGDDPSRLEAVPNAVMYSVFFANRELLP